MSAEHLIALEAAQAELGTLYTVARSFTALQRRAETELLPQITALGSRLRRLLRAAQLTPDEIANAAQEILSLRSRWQAALEQVHASAPYRDAVAALAADRQDELARLIPQVFAALRPVDMIPTLYFPISPATGRRRPGMNPFLSAGDCAIKIVQVLDEGMSPEPSGTEWWERELPSIGCADAMATLETPIALQSAATTVQAAVFAVADEPSFRIFTLRLRAPWSVVLAADVSDEWWEAYDDSYGAFRTALHHELAARGHTAAIA